MPEYTSRLCKWITTVLAAGMLLACASGSRAPAPIEDRSPTARTQTQQQPAPVVEAPRAGAGSENAGKPGYYVVRPGDTLIRIALDSGQNWRDLVRWNSIENPNVIEVGQVLRVLPPGALVVDGVVARPVVPGSATPAGVAPGAAASAPRPAASTAVASIAPANPAATTVVEEELAWVWPTAAGAGVLAGFDEQKNKGLDIAGKAGDAVLASADGRVVYAGAGLRGYGNLIILKHNNTYLSAYAHNQTLLVKEDQTVRKGQKIAEMGSSDADRVKLHFEIRRQGKPVDPARYLPAR